MEKKTLAAVIILSGLGAVAGHYIEKRKNKKGKKGAQAAVIGALAGAAVGMVSGKLTSSEESVKLTVNSKLAPLAIERTN